MPVAKLIAPTTKQEIPKLRVAAYCRVSSNSADQRNSFATQERVYTKYIAEKQEWELVDIFADEGLSGMKADNRPEFQRMIRMCELHQIDLILTKSVSRFARNVKDCLLYTSPSPRDRYTQAEAARHWGAVRRRWNQHTGDGRRDAAQYVCSHCTGRIQIHLAASAVIHRQTDGTWRVY